MDLGTREVIDALVLSAHRGGSPELRAALTRWPGRWYWTDRTRSRLVLVRAHPGGRGPRWALHGLLLVLAIICTLGAGAALAGVWVPSAPDGLRGIVLGMGRFFEGVFRGDWRLLLQGWSFAIPLLVILLVHESGHYFAARRYVIDVSPPFFLPIPPTISPIGTLGAFIRMRSPVLDRRQLLDVGAAGPLAGFVVAVLVLVWGLLVSTPATMPVGLSPEAGTMRLWVSFAGEPIALGDSVLTYAMREWLLPGSEVVHLSLPAFAGWVGVFVTGLNLLPLSQLDGGHVLYGVLGRHQRVVAGAAVVALLVLAQRSPHWYIWVVLTFLIGGGRWSHPSVVMPHRPVPPSRRWIGALSVVVFALTFMPVPFSI
ncbi:MAG: site-2 protease family protein [Gemmatimonadales bacterium]